MWLDVLRALLPLVPYLQIPKELPKVSRIKKISSKFFFSFTNSGKIRDPNVNVGRKEEKQLQQLMVNICSPELCCWRQYRAPASLLEKLGQT